MLELYLTVLVYTNYYAIVKIAITTARIILHLISYPQFTYDLFHMHHSLTSVLVDSGGYLPHRSVNTTVNDCLLLTIKAFVQWTSNEDTSITQ